VPTILLSWDYSFLLSSLVKISRDSVKCSPQTLSVCQSVHLTLTGRVARVKAWTAAYWGAVLPFHPRILFCSILCFLAFLHSLYSALSVLGSECGSSTDSNYPHHQLVRHQALGILGQFWRLPMKEEWRRWSGWWIWNCFSLATRVFEGMKEVR